MTTITRDRVAFDDETLAALGQAAPAARPLHDLSPRVGRTRRSGAGHRWRRRVLRVAGPVLILVAWQLVGQLGLVSEQVLPTPTDVLGAFGELIRTGDLQAALPVSLRRALFGLAIGATIGLVLGLFAGLWKIGEELFDAPLQMLRTVPFIALVPLFIMWFGIDETPKTAIILAATIFPMYLNTYAGVRGVDPKLIEAGRIFGLRGVRLSRRVILPTALPSIFVGLRYAFGVSVLALVAAEQINARAGIGYIMTNANMNQRPDLLIAGVIVYAVIGIAIDLLMRLVERAALPWRPSVAR